MCKVATQGAMEDEPVTEALGKKIFHLENELATNLSEGQRDYILEGGKIKLEGQANDLLKNEEMIKHYLGV